MNQLMSVARYEKISEGRAIEGKRGCKDEAGESGFCCEFQKFGVWSSSASLLGGLTQRDAEIREQLSSNYSQISRLHSRYA